jgi:hypothetical protein
MRWEQVPAIPVFSDNTAAFIHDLPADAIANATGASNYIPRSGPDAGGRPRPRKATRVVKELTEIVTAAAARAALGAG